MQCQKFQESQFFGRTRWWDRWPIMLIRKNGQSVNSYFIRWKHDREKISLFLCEISYKRRGCFEENSNLMESNVSSIMHCPTQWNIDNFILPWSLAVWLCNWQTQAALSYTLQKTKPEKNRGDYQAMVNQRPKWKEL